MRILKTLAIMATAISALGQNVGIGTTTPTGPLSFANQVGNKIVLWGDGNSNHYGIGVQSTFLQLYADLPNSHIVFGHGRSGAFNERVRISNSGADGMTINGRLHLRNGTLPLNSDFSPGIWLYKPDNSGPLAFIGTQNNQNIGFFGGAANWGFTYDAINSRVGIGNSNPGAPLAFANAPGKKIIFFQGGAGNVGIGVHNFEYRFHTDVEPADITFGYENLAGQFTERFRLKGNGGLALSGNTGLPGQVLTSNGNASVSWAFPLATAAVIPSNYDDALTYGTGSNLFTELTNMEMTVVVPAGQNARLFVSGNITCWGSGCTGLGCLAAGYFYFTVNGAQSRRVRFSAENGLATQVIHAMHPWDVGPGTYTIKWFVNKAVSATNNISITPLYASCQVVPR